MNVIVPPPEEWRNIECGPYRVSSWGRIRGSRGWVLEPRKHTNGYLRVSISTNGRPKDEYIHRIVCRAFHGEPPFANYHADHINGIRHDNRAENLRWASPEENRQRRRFARGEESGLASLSEATVREVLSLSKDGMRDRDLAQKFGIPRRYICDIRLRKVWSHIDA